MSAQAQSLLGPTEGLTRVDGSYDLRVPSTGDSENYLICEATTSFEGTHEVLQYFGAVFAEPIWKIY